MSVDNCRFVAARLRFALVQFSYFLIRGTARSILKAQHFLRQEFP